MTSTIEVLGLGETKIWSNDIWHNDGYVILPNEMILQAAKLIQETAGIEAVKDD